MPKVTRRTYDNGELEPLDELLRRFRRVVNDANILGECKKREFFVSKAEKRKIKAKEAALKRAKEAGNR